MPSLKERNIFVVPTEDVTGHQDEYLVYAPLADSMTLASIEECRTLEEAALHPQEASEEMTQTLDLLSDGVPAAERDNAVHHTSDFLLLYVLPNLICNFSCSYCFSAKGRGKGVLRKDQLKAAIDWFIDPNRASSKKLAISYLGGGEPTLSWDILKFGIEYGHRRAVRFGIHLYMTVVTNGSRITPEIVDTFSRCGVAARVSFEILEEIQNLQRAHYDDVCRGLTMLQDCAIPPMVRAMITPDNVNLLEQMIEELHQKFPRVRQVLMDPITSADTFHDVGMTRRFYDDYYNHFIPAYYLAERYGIRLACAPLRNLEMVVERFCTGEFCLTPQGTITICHHVASPKEKDYHDFQYAHIDDGTGKMVIDEDKFKELTQRSTVYSNPKCQDCFIKWNCGGGCLMQNMQYTPEILDVICDFTRRFSKYFLLKRIEDDA